MPPFTNSAVDGYALRGEDLPVGEEKTFPVADWIQAGASADHAAAPGRAIRIFTGAPMPAGADTVFMQEDVRVEEAGKVILPPGLKRGANVRPTGEDIAKGQVVLKAGHRLRPQDIALAAALGHTEVEVRRRIRVAVFSTGDEIVAPGAPRRPVQLFDSNRFMLMAMLARLGCAVDDLGILRDDPKAIASVLESRRRLARSDPDVRRGFHGRGGLRQGGGGERRQAGVLAHGHQARPAGRHGRDRRDALHRPAGQPGGELRHLRLPGPPGDPGAVRHADAAAARRRWCARPSPTEKKRAVASMSALVCARAADGTFEAVKFPREGAGLLSSLVETDGLVELREQTSGVEPGQSVAFLAYSSLV